jgi:hypothetical protein
MDHPVAGLDVRSEDLGQLVARVPVALLEDFRLLANGAAILAAGHLKQTRAYKVLAEHRLAGDDVEQKDILEGGRVLQQGSEGAVREAFEGVVVGGEDREVPARQRAVQACGLDRGAQRFETLGSAGELRNGGAAGGGSFLGARNRSKREAGKKRQKRRTTISSEQEATGVTEDVHFRGMQPASLPKKGNKQEIHSWKRDASKAVRIDYLYEKAEADG